MLNMATLPTARARNRAEDAPHCKGADETCKAGRRGLLVHGGALGDFVLSIRVILALRGAGMQSITLLSRGGTAALALRYGIAESAFDLETGGYHGLFSELA